MPLDSITDRLHIGNRWLGHLGLAMYDNTARVHDPVMPHMLTCDKYASKFPNFSPFSHCAGNPANLVDRDGNEIKLFGTANAQNKTLNLLSNSIGNYYSLSLDDNNHVTMELNPEMRSKENLTRLQQKLVNRLESMVNDDFEMYLHTFDNSTYMVMGNTRRKYIDVGDMLNVTSDEICSPEQILWHELVEQWIYQKKAADDNNLSADKESQLINSAHRAACIFESAFSNGKYKHDENRTQTPTMLIITVTDTQTQQTSNRVIDIVNGNIVSR